MKKLSLTTIKISNKKTFLIPLKTDYFCLAHFNDKNTTDLALFPDDLEEKNFQKYPNIFISAVYGFQKIKKLHFANFSPRSHLTFYDFNELSNVETLIFESCCIDKNLTFLDTSGFKNLKKFSISNSCVEGCLAIKDIRFFNNIEEIEIKNCGNYLKGFLIEDTIHELEEKKFYLLLKALIEDLNNGIGKINVKIIPSLHTKSLYSQDLQELKQKLIKKGWTINIQ